MSAPIQPYEPLSEERSPEIHDIIGIIPNWITRRGIAVILSVLLLSVYISGQIRFPELVEGRVIIHASEQPYRLTWFESEPNETFRQIARSGQTVSAGDSLLLQYRLTDKETMVIRSPVKGEIIVLHGTEKDPKANVMLVSPTVKFYEVELLLPALGIGLVKAGQTVQLKLDAYPSNDFGMLEGEVIHVIPYPIDNQYRASVRLTNGLRTTLDKIIPLQSYLTGKAEVVISSKSLFRRVFSTLH